MGAHKLEYEQLCWFFTHPCEHIVELLRNVEPTAAHNVVDSEVLSEQKVDVPEVLSEQQVDAPEVLSENDSLEANPTSAAATVTAVSATSPSSGPETSSDTGVVDQVVSFMRDKIDTCRDIPNDVSKYAVDIL